MSNIRDIGAQSRAQSSVLVKTSFNITIQLAHWSPNFLFLIRIQTEEFRWRSIVDETLTFIAL